MWLWEKERELSWNAFDYLWFHSFGVSFCSWHFFLMWHFTWCLFQTVTTSKVVTMQRTFIGRQRWWQRSLKYLLQYSGEKKKRWHGSGEDKKIAQLHDKGIWIQIKCALLFPVCLVQHCYNSALEQWVQISFLTLWRASDTLRPNVRDKRLVFGIDRFLTPVKNIAVLVNFKYLLLLFWIDPYRARRMSIAITVT